jgi:6-phosphofructokinase
MGRAFGLAAAELVIQRKYGNMVSLRNNIISFVPFTDAIRKDNHGKTILNLVDIEMEYDTERYIAKRQSLGMKMN